MKHHFIFNCCRWSDFWRMFEKISIEHIAGMIHILYLHILIYTHIQTPDYHPIEVWKRCSFSTVRTLNIRRKVFWAFIPSFFQELPFEMKVDLRKIGMKNRWNWQHWTLFLCSVLSLNSEFFGFCDLSFQFTLPMEALLRERCEQLEKQVEELEKEVLAQQIVISNGWHASPKYDLQHGLTLTLLKETCETIYFQAFREHSSIEWKFKPFEWDCITKQFQSLINEKPHFAHHGWFWWFEIHRPRHYVVCSRFSGLCLFLQGQVHVSSTSSHSTSHPRQQGVSGVRHHTGDHSWSIVGEGEGQVVDWKWVGETWPPSLSFGKTKSPWRIRLHGRLPFVCWLGWEERGEQQRIDGLGWWGRPVGVLWKMHLSSWFWWILFAIVIVVKEV